ncbi:hypothetical protein GALMADRAFT_22871, partial [Galerina marginata CBS 339.88]
PPDFDGDRSLGRSFLFTCRTYIRLVPTAFPDVTVQILWVLSFMKSGRAFHWAERKLALELTEGFPWNDWAEFERDFRYNFTPAHAAATAINILEGLTYFQQSRSVDDYLDEFLDLVHDSQYTDPRTI